MLAPSTGNIVCHWVLTRTRWLVTTLQVTGGARLVAVRRAKPTPAAGQLKRKPPVVDEIESGGVCRATVEQLEKRVFDATVIQLAHSQFDERV